MFIAVKHIIEFNTSPSIRTSLGVITVSSLIELVTTVYTYDNRVHHSHSSSTLWECRVEPHRFERDHSRRNIDFIRLPVITGSHTHLEFITV
jgi:hypothetical protein